MTPSTISRSSTKSLSTICNQLPAIATKHHFGVLGIHDLREKMVSKGVPFEQECRVFEVCNPHQAQAILLGNIEVSAALPCRISVYTKEGRTMLATIHPASLLGLFGESTSQARGIAAEVERSLVAIMDEACAA
jgi:uncharacterized protein (DUF302 family)